MPCDSNYYRYFITSIVLTYALDLNIQLRTSAFFGLMINFGKGEFEYPIKRLEENLVHLRKKFCGDDFLSVKYLCYGTTSLIYTARIQNNEEVVVKMLKQKLPNYYLAEKEMATEVAILNRTRHPNIVEFKGAGQSVRKFFALEYLNGGTLEELLSPKTGKCHHLLPLVRVISISLDILSALKYLHDDFLYEASVIHRDLKPQNIGFTADGRLKLFDFGLAACVKKRVCTAEAYEMTGFTGTLVYMAPEVALHQPYSEKVDIYSFGMILWQMLSGEVPFMGICKEEYIQHVVVDGQRPTLLSPPSDINGRDFDRDKEQQQWKGLAQLMQLCWDSDSNHRPSASALLAHLELISTGKPLHWPSITAPPLFIDNWTPIIM